MKKIKDKIESLLEDDLVCTRDWSAWGYGTMSKEDFVPLSETERPYELAELFSDILKIEKIKAEIRQLDFAISKVKVHRIMYLSKDDMDEGDRAVKIRDQLRKEIVEDLQAEKDKLEQQLKEWEEAE